MTFLKHGPSLQSWSYINLLVHRTTHTCTHLKGYYMNIRLHCIHTLPTYIHTNIHRQCHTYTLKYINPYMHTNIDTYTNTQICTDCTPMRRTRYADSLLGTRYPVLSKKLTPVHPYTHACIT